MLPPFAPPIRRPEVVHPFRAVSLTNGETVQILDRLFDLVHGMNYNDPQRFIMHGYDRLKTQQLGRRR
jgi:cyanobactin biosynthesis protein (PatB/AcyB/McaB family)